MTITRPTTRWSIIFCLILFSLVPAGCKTSSNWINLSFENISRGSHCGIEQKAIHIVTSAAQWVDIIEDTSFFRNPEFGIDVPDVDFNNEFILIVFRGQFNSAGYDIEITKVESDGERLRVEANEHEPGNCSVALVLTTPFHIVKVQRKFNITPFTDVDYYPTPVVCQAAR